MAATKGWQPAALNAWDLREVVAVRLSAVSLDPPPFSDQAMHMVFTSFDHASGLAAVARNRCLTFYALVDWKERRDSFRWSHSIGGCRDATRCSDAARVQPSPQSGLEHKIGPARAGLYRRPGEADKWRNPIVIIKADRIELILRKQVQTVRSPVFSLPSAPPLFGGPELTPLLRTEYERSSLRLADLQRELTSLPVTAWPYGRVIAVQEASLGSGTRQEREQISALLEQAVAVLQRVRLSIAYWPA